MFWNGNGMCALILNVNIINQFLLTFITLLGWHLIAAGFVIILANSKACNSQLFQFRFYKYRSGTKIRVMLLIDQDVSLMMHVLNSGCIRIWYIKSYREV